MAPYDGHVEPLEGAATSAGDALGKPYGFQFGGAAVYRVTEGIVIVREGADPSRVASTYRKLRPVGSRVYSTGRLWRGQGVRDGLWAELDSSRPGGRNVGWALVQGPGYGVAEALLLQEGMCSVVEVRSAGPGGRRLGDFVLPKGADVAALLGLVAGRLAVPARSIKLMKAPAGPFEEWKERCLPAYQRAEELHGCTLHVKVDAVPGTKSSNGREDSVDTAEPESGDDVSPDGDRVATGDGAEKAEVTGPLPAAEDAYFEVVHRSVALRSEPSTRARQLGGLAKGRILYGTPYRVGGSPWLRLAAAECQKAFVPEEHAWVLIHGACVGLGQLLRRLEPEDLDRYLEDEAYAAHRAAERERATGEQKQRELDGRRASLEARMADLLMRELDAGPPAQTLKPGECHFEVKCSSLTVHAAPSVHTRAICTLGRGSVVQGLRCDWMAGDPWVRLSASESLRLRLGVEEAWALIEDSSSQNVILLQQLTPEQEEERLRMSANVAIDAERRALEEESVALEQAERRLEEARLRAQARLGAVRAAAEAAAAGGVEARYEVVCKSVAVRSSPSVDAEAIGGLPAGRIVSAAQRIVHGEPWLRLTAAECRRWAIPAEEAWVLAHGGAVGLGPLLRRLAPSRREGAADGVPAFREDARLRSPSPMAPLSAAREGNVAGWGVEDVVAFVASLDLAHLEGAVRENAVDGAILLALREEEFCSELGLTRLQAKKLMTRIPRLD